MPKKTDRNQAAIVAALREIPGVSVQDLHEVGRGCPDILVGYRGFTWRGSYVNNNWVFEIKVPGGKLNDREREWHAIWRGPAAVITSADEALRIMGVID